MATDSNTNVVSEPEYEPAQLRRNQVGKGVSEMSSSLGLNTTGATTVRVEWKGWPTFHLMVLRSPWKGDGKGERQREKGTDFVWAAYRGEATT